MDGRRAGESEGQPDDGQPRMDLVRAQLVAEERRSGEADDERVGPRFPRVRERRRTRAARAQRRGRTRRSCAGPRPRRGIRRRGGSRAATGSAARPVRRRTAPATPASRRSRTAGSARRPSRARPRRRPSSEAGRSTTCRARRSRVAPARRASRRRAGRAATKPAPRASRRVLIAMPCRVRAGRGRGYIPGRHGRCGTPTCPCPAPGRPTTSAPPRCPASRAAAGSRSLRSPRTRAP